MNRINLMFSLRQGLTMCGRAPTAPAHKKQWNVDVSALARFSFVAITVSCAPIDLTAQSSPAAAHPVVSTAAQPAASVTTDSVADDQTLRHVHQHIEADGVQSADATFDPGWWQPLVSQPIRPEDSSAGLTLDDTLLRALEHSRQIQVFRDLPLIRETTIIEADAAFDWTAFTEARCDVEIIPIDMPVFESLPVELDESITIAFQKRPELKQAIKNIKAAAVRLQMAKHELLPVLDLVTNFYLSGLEGQGQAFDAWANQFDTGRPSYGFGLEYELPILNRGHLPPAKTTPIKSITNNLGIESQACVEGRPAD